jgi:hypothetical protein
MGAKKKTKAKQKPKTRSKPRKIGFMQHDPGIYMLLREDLTVGYLDVTSSGYEHWFVHSCGAASFMAPGPGAAGMPAAVSIRYMRIGDEAHPDVVEAMLRQAYCHIQTHCMNQEPPAVTGAPVPTACSAWAEPGTYDVIQFGMNVGELVVEPIRNTEGDLLLHQHWSLYANYVRPGETHPDVTTTYVHRAPYTEGVPIAPGEYIFGKQTCIAPKVITPHARRISG